MTSDGRSTGPHYPRPSAALRRRTLVGDTGATDNDSSFRAVLDDIPDLERGPSRSSVEIRPPLAARPTDRRAVERPRPVPAVAVEPSPPTGRVRIDAPAEETPYPPARRRAPWWRRLSFALVLLLLFGSIPYLGLQGYRLVTNSRAGRSVDRSLGKTDPNYVEEVQSTPTAVVAQTDADGNLVALTVLALNSGNGGTVIFMPVDTLLPKAQFFIKTVEQKFENANKKVDTLGLIVGDVINAGIDEVDALDERTFAQWFAPIGNITIENPDAITLPDGKVLEPGAPAELTPAEIGPYLEYRAPEGEDQLSQYSRHQLVWQAWLAAVAEHPEAVGSDAQGLGMFLAKLAKGPTQFLTVPGHFSDDGTEYVTDTEQFTSELLDAIPTPSSPRPGARQTIQLLNGVEAGASPPASVVRTLVTLNGTISVIGNGPSFGQDRTKFIYGDHALDGQVKLMAVALGVPDAEVEYNAASADRADITIIMGKDLRDAVAAATTTTTTTTTAATDPFGETTTTGTP